MGAYFISGSPYSEDELYHFGILGQKWGIRRFQNEDRTWTEAGKIRYGAQKAGEAVGKAVRSTGRVVSKAVSATGKGVGRAASKTGKHVVDNFKSKHPWMMSDDELNNRLRRVNMEKTYQQDLRDTHQTSGARKLIGNILENGARTLANAAFNKLASNMVKTPLERANDILQNKIKNKELNDKLGEKKISDFDKAKEVLENPEKYSAKDIRDASGIINSIKSGRLALKEVSSDVSNSTVQKEATKSSTETSSRSSSGKSTETSSGPSYTSRRIDDETLGSNNAITIRGDSERFKDFKMTPIDGSEKSSASNRISDSENELLKRYQSRGASSSGSWNSNISNSINLGKEAVDLLFLGYY